MSPPELERPVGRDVRAGRRLPAVAAIACLALLGADTPAARAGWIKITNDTNSVIVIQDCGEAKRPGRGKLIRLLPGETYREFQAGAGEKKVQIFDLQLPGTPLFEGPLRWKKDDVSLSVLRDGKTVKLGPPTVAASTNPPTPVKPVAHR